jgi:hypothetical protein
VVYGVAVDKAGEKFELSVIDSASGAVLTKAPGMAVQNSTHAYILFTGVNVNMVAGFHVTWAPFKSQSHVWLIVGLVLAAAALLTLGLLARQRRQQQHSGRASSGLTQALLKGEDAGTELQVQRLSRGSAGGL